MTLVQGMQHITSEEHHRGVGLLGLEGQPDERTVDDEA